MRLLLDENLPKQLLKDFPEHEVSTIQQKGWGGKSNGELLKLMLESDVEVFLTADKNLQHQQNFTKYPIPVLVIHVFRLNYNQIKPLLPQIKKLLETSLINGPTIISSQ